MPHRRPRTRTALLVLVFAAAGCFSPTGQNATATTTDTTLASTSTAPTTTSTSTPTTTTDPVSTTATTSTSDPSTSTSSPSTSDPSTSTSTSTSDSSTGTTAVDTTGMSSTGPDNCGDGNIDIGEECDDGNQDNTDSCTILCMPPACGDGFPQGAEECDDGPANAVDGECLPSCLDAKCDDGFVCPACGEECDNLSKDCNLMTCKFDYRVVFVSSAPVKPLDLGGIGGADDRCNEFAAAAPDLAGRTFVAWLSTSTVDAITRLGVTNVSYKRTDGMVVANNTADLVDATLLVNPINFDEKGMPVPDDDLPVWTGTEEDGTKYPDDFQCGDWSEADGMGRAGFKGAKNFTWTNWTDLGCDASGYLYCFQVTN